jgi:ABC-type dipeptide/oligopeptide/nickel transport system permease subunit
MGSGAYQLGKSPAQSERYSLPYVDRVRRFARRVNWPLLIGALITLFVILLAVFGPDWAPNDPMQENYALTVDGGIVRPPYSPFTLPGYPLGTDQFGRDLFSRLLYGVRPTMILVTSVAVVRLILGLILGYFIGWSTGIRGRFLDILLSIVLAIPVLIVALMGVSAVGIHKGLWAFIFGLAITGWAETARIVSSQIKTVRSQAFIEASHALGASDSRVFFKHVLPQISPLVWMLMAFEISATLFVISELGFLGYYIGGGVWIEVSDFVSVNTTGLPELGQMLSTALISFVKPIPLIVVSAMIFLMIMGFNLLGEGLRLRVIQQAQFGYRKSIFADTKLEDWFEKTLSPAAADWLETNAVRIGLIAAVFVVVGGWSIWWRGQPSRTPVANQQQLIVPGGHYWATERHDAQGARWVPFSGPTNSSVDWTYISEGGFVGGPVVSGEGVVYISTADQKLIALTAAGEELWQVGLENTPVRSPALGPGGEIYVSDAAGGLSAFNSDGSLLWRYAPKNGWEATSGPIVASDGTVYYTRVETIQAVSPEGEPLWQSFAYDGYVEQPPVKRAGESYIFLLSGALASSSGAKLVLNGLPVEELKFTLPTFFVGANGKTYLRTGHEVYGWWATEEGVEVDPMITWNYEGQVLIPPYDQGATPEELIWLFYAGDYFDTRLVWLDKNSNLAGNLRPPDRQSRMVAVDRESVSYVCSNNYNVNANCKAYSLDSANPLWVLELGEQASFVGGALAPSRFYIATYGGVLYAVGPGEETGSTEQTIRKTDDSPSLIKTGTPTPAPQETPTSTAITPTLVATISSEQAEATLTPESTSLTEFILRMPIIYR